MTTTDLAAEDRFQNTDALLGATRLAFFTPIRNYPSLADSKAKSILAADGLMISVFLIYHDRLVMLLHNDYLGVVFLILTLLASFSCLLLIGGFCAYIALTMPIPPMPESLAFFPEIARLSLDEYRSKITVLTHRQVVHKILIYNYSLATLCARKFALLRRAMACVRAQFFLWLVITLVAAFAGKVDPKSPDKDNSPPRVDRKARVTHSRLSLDAPTVVAKGPATDE